MGQAIHVLFAAADDTTVNDNFTCHHGASAQIIRGGGYIRFHKTPGLHVETGRKAIRVHYSKVTVMYVYEDE